MKPRQRKEVIYEIFRSTFTSSASYRNTQRAPGRREADPNQFEEWIAAGCWQCWPCVRIYSYSYLKSSKSGVLQLSRRGEAPVAASSCVPEQYTTPGTGRQFIARITTQARLVPASPASPASPGQPRRPRPADGHGLGKWPAAISAKDSATQDLLLSASLLYWADRTATLTQ